MSICHRGLLIPFLFSLMGAAPAAFGAEVIPVSSSQARAQFGAYLEPGQSISVRNLLGLDQSYCGIRMDQVIAESGSWDPAARLSLVVDDEFQDQGDVVGQPDRLAWTSLRPRAEKDVLCGSANQIKIVNGGTASVFVGSVVMNFSQTSTPPPAPSQEYQRLVRCISERGEFRECFMGQNVSRVQLYGEFSYRRCIQGRTWGVDFNRQTIAVTQGCQADFLVTYRY